MTFQELEEILLDIECFLNNQPLPYLDEGFEQRTITPNILIHGEPTTLLEESDNSLETVNNVSRRMRYLKRCSNQLRKRWANYYIKALTERRQPKHEKDPAALDNGRVILYKDYLKDNKKWKLGNMIKQMKGKDNVVRGYKIKTGNGHIIERSIQLVADLEIGKETSKNVTELNEKAPPVEPSTNYARNAKSDAKDRIHGVILNGNDE